MALLLRFLAALPAFVAACLLASTAAVTILGLHSLYGDDLGHTLTTVIPSYAFIIGYITAVPTALAVFILRTYSLRRWRNFAIAGAVIGLAGFAAMFAPAFLDDASGALADPYTYRMLWAFLVSGAAGGTGYWLVAFRLFGQGEARW